MNKGKITVVGIGPGNRDDITPAALSAIRQSDVIIGYNYYFQFIQDIIHPGYPMYRYWDEARENTCRRGLQIRFGR